MIRTDKRLWVCWILIAACLAFIWGNSLVPGYLSRAFSDMLNALVSDAITGEVPAPDSISNKLIRKVAHFGEFAALGSLLYWLHSMLKKHWKFVLFWGMAAACVDECLQFLSPGRAPLVLDVVIDVFGVASGMLLLSIGHSYWKRKTANHMEDKQYET